MKVLTILGARPQFIKAATVSRVIRVRGDIQEKIVHTGQHFDANMSDVFFEQLDIPRPDYNLQIAGLSHGAMTGRMLERIESLLQQEQPDWVMVYGDTNSTLAGALAASKLHIPVAHVEAGLRSHNPAMPEEINRVLTDRISGLLLCPTKTAISNLVKEGFPFVTNGPGNVATQQCIENVGDVMYDAVLYYREEVKARFSLDSFGLTEQMFALCTLHRQENTDDPIRLNEILSALRVIAKDLPIVVPLHPRTRKKIEQNHGFGILDGLMVLNPLSYLEIQRLQMSASAIITDSGGIQKEAYFHQIPCLTLREETEWTETLAAGANQLVGANQAKILDAWNSLTTSWAVADDLYGNGNAALKIVERLLDQ